jgi:hypothetical protein
MQNIPHVEGLGVREHNKFDVGRRLVVMQLVLTCPKRYEARTPHIRTTHLHRKHIYPYLSSGPPNFRTMFRIENMVPKISFASSCALSRAGRALAGPTSGAAAVLATLEPDMGLVDAPLDDIGRSCLAHSLE